MKTGEIAAIAARFPQMVETEQRNACLQIFCQAGQAGLETLLQLLEIRTSLATPLTRYLTAVRKNRRRKRRRQVVGSIDVPDPFPILRAALERRYPAASDESEPTDLDTEARKLAIEICGPGGGERRAAKRDATAFRHAELSPKRRGRVR